MNEFTVDFPLILLCLVFGSGLLWLLDSLFLAPSRKRRASALQAQYPRWSVEGSPDAERYQSEVAEKAVNLLLLSMPGHFFQSCWWYSCCAPLLSSLSKYRLLRWCPRWRWVTIF